MCSIKFWACEKPGDSNWLRDGLRGFLFQIKEHFAVKELLGTRIVCRTGSALLVSDLHKVAGMWETTLC